MSFPKYPEYKDSGTQWLASVPSHWEARRFKFLFNLQKRPPREDDGIVTAFRDGEVTLRSNRRTEGFTNAIHEIGYQGIRCGDLVIHAMDAFAGAIGVSDSNGKSTPVYSVCTPANASLNVGYYGRLLRHMALSGYVNSLAKGVRERSTEFRWADASEVVLPVPTCGEQAAIATFLDRETVKIDRLVAEQEKLIALLQEKRQAVISHAVTKGLDPNVPMKDSGVEWLGEVPGHWNVKRLRYLANIETGFRDTADAIEDGQFSFFVRSEKVERIGTYSFECEAVLTAGDGAGVGKIFHHFEGKFEAHQRVYVLHSFRELSGRFIYFYLRENFHRVALEGGAKSTVDSLRRPMFTSFPFVVPSVDEQEAIIKFVEREEQKFLSLSTKAEEAIALLQERRTALISAAVTGQIDVRSMIPGPRSL